MPGGNWYQYQHLNNGKVEWPTGPTEDIDQGFEPPRWVQAWVVQGGRRRHRASTGTSYPGQGPSQSSSESSWSGWEPPDQWTAVRARVGKRNLPGSGAATGIALLALYNRNTSPPTYEYQWWVKSDLILYED